MKNKEEEDKNIQGVNHPSHYSHRSGLDAIVWIDRYGMDFETGNCFKYLFRCGLKPGESEAKDTEKAKWYFRHESYKVKRTSCMLTWIEAKRRVYDRLAVAFGPPGKKDDGTEDWTVGGCDMPGAIETLNGFMDVEYYPEYQI